MDQELAQFFFEEASRVFAFLVSGHSFSGPVLQVDETIHFTTVTFIGKNLAIECILDEREGDVECKVARAANGTTTKHYAVDEAGVRVRESLAHLLRRRGIKDPLFTPIGKVDLRHYITRTLQDFAFMLKKHGQDILENSPAVLN